MGAFVATLKKLKKFGRVALVICLWFLLASTGYLLWLYRMLEFTSPPSSDLPLLALGYLAQAAGIGVYLVAVRGSTVARARWLATVSICLYCVTLALIATSSNLTFVFAAGCLANMLTGAFQGHYLALLASRVDAASRGTIFGCSYAASTLLTLLVSLPVNGALTRGAPCLVFCLLLSCAVLLLLYGGESPTAAKANRKLGLDKAQQEGQEVQDAPGLLKGPEASRNQELPVGRESSGHRAPRIFPTLHLGKAGARPGSAADDPKRPCVSNPGRAVARLDRKGPLLACATIFAVCFVHAIGFDFPTAALASGVSLELSRMLYGFGIAFVGIAADHERRFASFACVASLVAPFLMIALSGAGAESSLLWAIGYLLTGSYVLFSALIAVDMADDLGRPDQAGAGMFARYLGDAMGASLCFALSDNPLALIALASASFLVTATLFIMLYLHVLAPQPRAMDEEQRKRNLLQRFATHHDLTQRERDVLELVIAGKSNGEIAAELFISERTVKFHVTNILRKTECKTRREVISKYSDLEFRENLSPGLMGIAHAGYREDAS